jgi:hypothetical protein
VQVDYNVVHLQTSLVQLFVLLLQNFEKVVQMIELERFGGAPNDYPFAPLALIELVVVRIVPRVLGAVGSVGAGGRRSATPAGGRVSPVVVGAGAGGDSRWKVFCAGGGVVSSFQRRQRWFYWVR